MAKKRREFFELPFTMPAPQLSDAGVGIDRLTLSPQRSFELDITLLDAPDHRLLRAGVTLAHRVKQELGEWYLDAPEWQPWLPVDHVVELGAAGELPDDLAELVRPFRRLAPLGPVAAVSQQRQVFAIKGDDDLTLGTLRDERITIRRGGLTTARFREATLEAGPLMTPQQRRFLADALVAVGGVRVTAFPDPLHRLGAPGTGMSDFPEPRDYDSSTTLEVFVSSLFAERLRAVMRADLALRSGELARRAKQATSSSPPDLAADPLPAEPVFCELDRLVTQVRALAGVLEPSWRERLEADLGSVVSGDRTTPVHQLDERYYAVLDALVKAIRAPQLGDWSHRKASEVLPSQARRGLGILLGRLSQLTPEAPQEQWLGAQTAARQLLISVEGIGSLFGKRGRQLRKLLAAVVAGLAPGCVDIAEPTAEQLDQFSGAQAYQAGLAAAEAIGQRRVARTEFIEAWPALRARLDR